MGTKVLWLLIGMSTGVFIRGRIPENVTIALVLNLRKFEK